MTPGTGGISRYVVGVVRLSAPKINITDIVNRKWVATSYPPVGWLHGYTREIGLGVALKIVAVVWVEVRGYVREETDVVGHCYCEVASCPQQPRYAARAVV